MRTLRVGMFVFAMMLGATHYARGEALGLEIGALGSYVDSDDLGKAYGAGGKIKLNISEVIGLDVTGSYLEFDDSDVEMIPVEGTVLLQIPLGDTLKLYGGGGVGYYFFDSDTAELDDAVGYYPIAGLEITLGDIKLFGEVRWLFLSADVDEAGDELEGLVDGDEADVDGLGVNIGLSIGL
jgi:Outer membrane protein beta-barrel domain